MTQNEVVWALFSILQIGIVAFVGYWTRRIQKLEDQLAFVDRDLQGRVSRLEAQFAEIIKSLERIERHVERDIDRKLNHTEEEE